ncbi:MAG TPA: zinc ribbon domain-containing protein, partial [Candidatus Sulfotelmatobacter sp.]|nr:zinc ribbon domain-containing protein [Candidatus Sulfotelmatobacter sp.]
MAQPADKIEGEILPEPELNPLLNPLLAAHMGRWAEVYFTSPPEKRAQAVSDLVRELRSEPPPPPSAPVQPVVEQKPAPEPVREVKAFRVEPIPVSPGVEQSLQTCGECSAENPAQQKFCGMCGAALPSSPHHDESTFPSNTPAAIEETREEYMTETQSSRDQEQSTGNYAAQYAPDSSFSFGGYASRGSREQGRFAEDAYLPQFAVESPSVPYRYRLYIGMAVAVILGGLLYMAWHGTPNSSGDTSESVPSRVMPSAPSRATPASPPEPAPQRAVVPTDKASDTAPARATPSGAASSAPASTASNNSSGRQSQASSGSDTAQA